MPEISEQAMEARARRAAAKIGLVATKSHGCAGSVDNDGSFRIVDPYFNRIEAGIRFDLTPEDVIAYCKQ